MIRWCSWCCRFLGERAPFDSPYLTHGICEDCEATCAEDVPLRADHARFRAFRERIFARDHDKWESADHEARALGLSEEALLRGLLQPALYQTGLDWECAQISIEDEHRFTDFCAALFRKLAANMPAEPPVDLLILKAPGETHTLGPLFAAHALSRRGFSVEVDVSDLDREESVDKARRLRPGVIGFSCATPWLVPAVEERVAKVRERLEPDLDVHFVVSGFAFRQEVAAPRVGEGIEVVVDLDAFAAGLHARPSVALDGWG